MSAAQGTVRVLRCEGLLIFQVEGTANMAHSQPVCRLAEQCLAEGTTRLRVDLDRCTYLDSTFLGTLLFLKRAMKGGDFGLVSPSPACRHLLEEMKLADLFPVCCQEPHPAADWSELDCETEDRPAATRNLVRAHEELASVPGPAGEPFRGLALRLASELKADAAR